MFASCSKDDDPVVDPVRYYVKYEVQFSAPKANLDHIISIGTEKGEKSLVITDKDNTVVSWTGTYGPVDKNFIAHISCNTPATNYSQGPHTKIHARISLSKDNGPFFVKAEQIGTDILYLDYKIDF